MWALGTDPEVMRKRVKGKWGEEEQAKGGGEVEGRIWSDKEKWEKENQKETVRKQGEEEGDVREGRGREVT